MSGHNKWSQIKHRKGAQDAKKSAAFSKVLPAISIAAKQDPSPETNPRLRSLIEKARELGVPNENITRAITRSKDEKDLKEVVFEFIGPEGVAILVEGITDNSNRTLQQLRTLSTEVGCKPADPGSLLWAFTITSGPGRDVTPKFPQEVSVEAREQLRAACAAFEDHEDVQRVITNALLS